MIDNKICLKSKYNNIIDNKSLLNSTFETNGADISISNLILLDDGICISTAFVLNDVSIPIENRENNKAKLK